MYIERFISRDKILPLKLLGKRRNPFQLEVDPKTGLNKPRSLLPLIPTIQEQRVYSTEDIELADVLRHQGNILPIIYSRCIADGVKVFRPTTVQLMAMENVEVNIPFEEYHQPYPAYIIELPEQYRNWLKESFTIVEAPKYELVCDLGFLPSLLFATWINSLNVIAASCSKQQGCRTIEDAFRATAGNRIDIEGVRNRGEDDFLVAERLHRLATIFGLFIVHQGVRKVAALDGDPRLRKRFKNDRQRKEAKRKKSLADAGQADLYDFNQEIKFYAFDSNRDSEGESTGMGTKKRPHVRRGYMRHQHYGPGRGQVKIIFVPHTFVNLKYYHGDTSDLTALYTELDKRPSKVPSPDVQASRDLLPTARPENILPVNCLPSSGGGGQHMPSQQA